MGGRGGGGRGEVRGRDAVVCVVVRQNKCQLICERSLSESLPN